MTDTQNCGAVFHEYRGKGDWKVQCIHQHLTQVISCIFFDMNNWGNGGAINCEGSEYLTVNSSTFVSCIAGEYGGAIASYNENYLHRPQGLFIIANVCLMQSNAAKGVNTFDMYSNPNAQHRNVLYNSNCVVNNGVNCELVMAFGKISVSRCNFSHHYLSRTYHNDITNHMMLFIPKLGTCKVDYCHCRNNTQPFGLMRFYHNDNGNWQNCYQWCSILYSNLIETTMEQGNVFLEFSNQAQKIEIKGVVARSIRPNSGEKSYIKSTRDDTQIDISGNFFDTAVININNNDVEQNNPTVSPFVGQNNLHLFWTRNCIPIGEEYNETIEFHQDGYVLPFIGLLKKMIKA